MAFRSSSASSGTDTVPVPAGAATDDIAIIVITIDNTAAVVETADYPSGFTELAQTDITRDGQTVAVAWKRFTAADAGNYGFGAVGATIGLIQCALFSGRHTTNPPVISTTSVDNSALTNPVTINANGVTALAGDDLVWVSAPDVTTSGAGNLHTVPSGYTNQQDTELTFSNLCLATKDNVSAGATGTQSGSFAITGGTSGYAAWTIRIPSAGGGGGVTVYNRTLDSPIFNSRIIQ